MIDNTPYRTDIIRTNNNFDDLARQLIITFKTYQELESKISPLVARNIDNSTFYLSKDWIKQQVKNSFGMDSIMYNRMLDAIELFYSKNKTTRRLPSPHIISHRSVHYGDGLFEIKPIDLENYLNTTANRIRNFKVNNVFEVSINGLVPFYIENMKPGKYRYMILRPKLGKSGAPMPDKWEVLLYSTNLGYHVEHIDTNKNPRYNGTI